MQLRDYQKEAVASIYGWFERAPGNPLVVAPTGCHAAGTAILMADGSEKPVQDISVGDTIMGPDSRPRRVLHLCRGVDEMYRITPKKGSPFVVNAGHVLALKATGGAKMGGIGKGDVTCVTVSEYISKSNTWKHVHKLHRTPANFPSIAPPPISPYVIGAMIGDGYLKYSPRISNPDHEVLDAVWDEMKSLGLHMTATTKTQNITNWDVAFVGNKGAKNPAVKILSDLGLWGKLAAEKFIPASCKIGDIYTRAQVLAGLLDTDGHLGRGGFDFISKSRQLAEDVVFVARSLGLAAYMRERQKACQNGFSANYWRVSISGDLSIIPTRVPRKQASPRKQVKDVLVTGFSVCPIGKGEFFGFTLDEDHLYLTADFTVHHNSGKSVILAEFTRSACEAYAGTRILIVTHVKELIAQNHAALCRMWPGAPAGIYSAGLGRRQGSRQIVVAGVQSIAKKTAELGYFDLVIVDEAHLIPRDADTLYGKLFAGLRETNPDLKIVGLTATPYRTDSGRLDGGDGSLFDGIAYDIPVRMLVERGYLAPLVSKRPGTVFDTSGLHTRMGDFIEREMVDRFATDEVTRAAVSEIVTLGKDRRSWIAFCISVEHAEAVAAEIRSHGISAACVTGKTPHVERDRLLRDYKAGRIRALTSVGVLTTGFDAPGTDLLAFLRPTKSTGLYMQMAGRAMRTVYAPGFDLETTDGRLAAIAAGPKQNGLVLDFAGNVARHGPVDGTMFVTDKGAGKGDGEAPTKTCPSCQSILLIAARECPDCGFEFPEPEKKIERTASTEAIMILTAEDEWQEVRDFDVSRHVKAGSPDSLVVEYLVGTKTIREWVCLEHTGFARQKAAQWWLANASAPVPDTVTDALERRNEIRAPDEAVIIRDGKYHRIKKTRHGQKDAA